MSSKHSLQFIDSATVPVIKLQIDLQKISKVIQRQEKYSGSLQISEPIPESMRYLGIDITFEDASNKDVNLGI